MEGRGLSGAGTAVITGAGSGALAMGSAWAQCASSAAMSRSASQFW